MKAETIARLSKLRTFSPANFDINSEYLKIDIQIIRLTHLKLDGLGKLHREKLCSFIKEVTQEKIRDIIEQTTGFVTGFYHKKSYTIALNCDLDRGKAANELNRMFKPKIKPDEVYVWIYFHGVGHKKGLDEPVVDLYAWKRFVAWKEKTN